MDDEAQRELQRAAQAPTPLDPEFTLGSHAATKRLLMTAKPSSLTLPKSHAPLAAPEIIHSSESAVSALQDTIAEYAVELRSRAQAGNINAKDGKLVAALAGAAAKLAAEQREQAQAISLALQSDEDIVRLVIDSVRALGPRGQAILSAALNTLNQENLP